MNYTEATSTCRSHRGYLAHIMSDERTNFLSFMIQQQNFDSNKTVIVTETATADSSRTSESTAAAAVPINIPFRHAFVGLMESQVKGNFIDSFDIPIRCFHYRAWAPKYPM